MLLWETLSGKSADNGDSAATPESRRAGGTKRLPFDKRCAGVTRAGRRCRARIRQGSEYCSFHDPAMTSERRKSNAAKGGRSHHRLSNLPDGYLRKLTSRRAVGDAMDRLYREVRLGVITPEMGSVLFGILTRIMDSGLCDGGVPRTKPSTRSKADRIRPQLADLLTRAERRAWRKAVASAPEDFIRNRAIQKRQEKAPKESSDSSDTAIRLALTAS